MHSSEGREDQEGFKRGPAPVLDESQRQRGLLCDKILGRIEGLS